MTYQTVDLDLLDPAIEHNTINILDRLRPVGTLSTFAPEDARFEVLPVRSASASSERQMVNRLVTGSQAINWPPPDKSINAFVVSGSEEEAGYFYGSNREVPVIFQTVETTRAYSDVALTDDTYGSAEFYEDDGGLTPYDHYTSVHYGPFSPFLAAIFPFLATITVNQVFTANQAIANQNTPLMLEGSSL